jgi:hypothetical protein
MGNHEIYGDPYRSAVVAQPSSAQLGGDGPLPFVRFPFYPTSPWYSTNPNVGYQTRFYAAVRLSSTDSDFVVGSEAIRNVQFDLPCRVVAINGAAASVDDDPVGSGINEQNMNLLYDIRVEYTNGDKLTTLPRIAASIVGTARNPGEIGGHGYNVDQGATLLVGITPRVTDIVVDITFVCLEMRGPRNYTVQGR